MTETGIMHIQLAAGTNRDSHLDSMGYEDDMLVSFDFPMGYSNGVGITPDFARLEDTKNTIHTPKFSQFKCGLVS